MSWFSFTSLSIISYLEAVTDISSSFNNFIPSTKILWITNTLLLAGHKNYIMADALKESLSSEGYVSYIRV